MQVAHALADSTVGGVGSIAFNTQTIVPSICFCACAEITRCNRISIIEAIDLDCGIREQFTCLRFDIGPIARFFVVDLLDVDPKIGRVEITRCFRRDDQRVVRAHGYRQKLAEDFVLGDRFHHSRVDVRLRAVELVATQQFVEFHRCFVTIFVLDRTVSVICVCRHDTATGCQITINTRTRQGYGDGCATDIGIGQCFTRQFICSNARKITSCFTSANGIEVERPPRGVAIGFVARCVDEIVTRTCIDVGFADTGKRDRIVRRTCVDSHIIEDRLVQLLIVVPIVRVGASRNVVTVIQIEINSDRIFTTAGRHIERRPCVVKRVTIKKYVDSIVATTCGHIVRLGGLIAIIEQRQRYIATALRRDSVGVGDPAGKSDRVCRSRDFTERQITKEGIRVDQLEVTILRVVDKPVRDTVTVSIDECIILIETITNGQAGIGVARSKNRIGCDEDLSKFIARRCDRAKIGRLGHATIRVFVSGTQNVDVEHFDTIGNAVGCFCILAANDEVTTFATTACLVQIDVNGDRLIFNFIR